MPEVVSRAGLDMGLDGIDWLDKVKNGKLLLDDYDMLNNKFGDSITALDEGFVKNFGDSADQGTVLGFVDDLALLGQTPMHE